MTDVMNESLDPSQFDFWFAPAGMTMTTGEDTEIDIPQIPLPIRTDDFSEHAVPSEKSIGDGIYEYLSRFPFCPMLKRTPGFCNRPFLF